jgi:hypothetical protein
MEIQMDPTTLSPKTVAAAVGAALATILWTCLAAFVPQVRSSLTESTLIALTGATATVFAFILGYFIPDPLRNAPPNPAP